MIRTQKERLFLERLERLARERDLSVELVTGVPDTSGGMVLRGTYGDRIHRTFGMSRQGVRWRFHRLFNEVYVSAFETILLIENTFGTELRDHALQISRERHAARREAARTDPMPSSPTDSEALDQEEEQ